MLSRLMLSTAILAGASLAQEPVESPPAEVRTTPASVDELVQRLGSDSYRDRLDAENELQKLGEKARAALEKAAGDDGDREVQWRAKRLLRQLERADRDTDAERQGEGLVERRGRQGQDRDVEIRDRIGRGDGWTRVDDMRAQFDQLFRRFEQDFGLDVPRHRFFDDTFFQDLRSQLRGAGSSQGMSVQIGPDGVVVEVQQKGEDGKAETKTYEAPDLETFRKNYPGVLEQNGLGLGLDPLRVDRMRGLFGPIQRGFDRRMVQPHRVPFDDVVPTDAIDDVPPPQGRRLGVMVQPLPEALRDYLELDADTGLMVRDVQDGTLAAMAKLQKHDIVTAINGERVGSPRDVARILGGIDKGAEVRIEFIRKGSRSEVTVDKQHAAEPVREPLPAKRLEPRDQIR